MRLAVLADIHGNLPALEAVLADVHEHIVDGVIVAGDSTGGPAPNATYSLLRSFGAWMIKGNSEDYFLAFDAGEAPDAWSTSEQWATMRWGYERLNRETLGFVASLPEKGMVALDGNAPIRVVHGSMDSATQHLIPDRDPATLRAFEQAGLALTGQSAVKVHKALLRCNEPVLVCGHSHIPWVQEQDARLVLNPGSVGLPINGDWRAQYALLTWDEGHWRATHRAVVYDLERLRQDYALSGLLAAGGAFARACLRCSETGHNFPGFFLSHVQALAADVGYTGALVVPDEIWERATATFDWESAP
jgi:predicted phosphodiesterase